MVAHFDHAEAVPAHCCWRAMTIFGLHANLLGLGWGGRLGDCSGQRRYLFSEYLRRGQHCFGLDHSSENSWSECGPLRQSIWMEIAQLIVGDVAAGSKLPQCPWGPAVHMPEHFMLF
jgi:hypothetical protein